MGNNIAAPFIPAQYTGEETATSAIRKAEDESAARRFFQEAMERLVDVNHWANWCGTLLSAFQLVNAADKPIDGFAETGMYIRIDIPGPGTNAGKGFDWVKIEQKEHVILNTHQEVFFIRARPSEHPVQKHSGIAHFLRKEASSSFVITRDHNTVTASVYGRNEVPNTKVADIADKIRNAIIGSSSAMSVSKIQWKALVEGILS
ncbi:hypothetical protein CLV51_10994 [Chitinophaga niastensis]|uniref:Uncharacterized protein n=1 Tax=Chitinophaga niastensis TaxID=536980 RepID=A0A2P8HA78_CHINA|nr:hypothetical protein [Chitinophaga niastensis]PSL43100.1 hypothetical protein CLV51_10994 [Chitinophaga niastensis]